MFLVRQFSCWTSLATVLPCLEEMGVWIMHHWRANWSPRPIRCPCSASSHGEKMHETLASKCLAILGGAVCYTTAISLNCQGMWDGGTVDRDWSASFVRRVEQVFSPTKGIFLKQRVAVMVEWRRSMTWAKLR
jgi:hypothetical protein